jgi:RHS repeat-associated protein
VTYSAGNPQNDGMHSYTWDANWGTLASIDTTTVIHDALGRIVEQQNGTTNTQVMYGPTGKLALMNGQTEIQSFEPLPGGGTFVHRPGSLTNYWRHPDVLGSSRLATTLPGRLKFYDVAYAPFGEDYAGSGTTDLSFTGQTQDTSTTVGGLYDFQFREYAARQGRWVSPDPAGSAAVDPLAPQTWNRYAYVMNNPLGYIDPLGLACYPFEKKEFGRCPIPVPAFGASWNVFDLMYGGYACENGDCGYHSIVNGLAFAVGWLPPLSPNNLQFDVKRRFSKTFKCKSNASGVMAALENNFSSFADNPSPGGLSTFAIFTPGPVSPGQTLDINVGIQAFGRTVAYNDVSVVVQSSTPSQLVFQSTSSHVLYPATVSFSASDVGDGSINFTTSVDATTNGLLGTFQFLLGGRAGETNTWTNLLSQVGKFCGN